MKKQLATEENKRSGTTMEPSSRPRPRPSGSSSPSPTNSASQSLLLLVKTLLGPLAPHDVVSSQYALALQILSNASSGWFAGGPAPKVGVAKGSAVADGETAVAEKIKKRLVRDGRESDAVTFHILHQRLQKSKAIQNRESLLTLLLYLGDRPSAPKYKKVAPFVPFRSQKEIDASRMQSTTMQNGSSLTNGSSTLTPAGDQPTASYLSSIHDIRHHLTPSGYHPPLPPKPKSPIKVLKSRSTSDVPDSAIPSVSASEVSGESALLRELIYSFQGIEGKMIRRDRRTDRFCITEQHKSNFSPSVIQTCLRLTELGWLFNKVKGFCDATAADREVGLTAQALATALNNELAEYYRLLSALEAQLRVESDKAGNNVSVSLHHLSVWTLEPTNRLKLLASVVDACKGLRGGALVSAVYAFLPHGDQASSQTIHTLLCTVCRPLYLTLLRWVCDGSLEDPHQEFFIASDPRVEGDRLWTDKYSINKEMIPKFLSLSWVKKILATGKSINFLHEVCHDNSPIIGRDVVKASLNETSPESFFLHPHGDSLLHRTIQRAFTETSSHVLSILFTRYKFLDHISALRKYLLLGQGDIIRYLLELLEEELGKPATSLYPHNLAGVLETAIRATNAQFEDPEILERLDVRLLDISPGDTGWDVFSLDYKMAGPIGTVFNSDVMIQYLMLFNALWRAKRVEWMLSCVWKRQAALHKMAKTIPELRPLLHIANLLTSEMVHFIHQLAYYITFEVMECSWDILIKQLRKAESLDEVIEAHEEFLQTLMKRSLLDDRSRDLLTQLRAIYDRIIEFQGIQNKLYISAVAEVEARREDEALMRQYDGTSEYAAAKEETSRERIRTFNKIILQNLKSQLKIVSQTYQDMVRTFLLQLACSQDQSLQFLSFRLDFNQHYKRKDARLGTPLTFQHRRESMLTSSIHV